MPRKIRVNVWFRVAVRASNHDIVFRGSNHDITFRVRAGE